MRSLIVLLLVVAGFGGAAYWLLSALANMEPRTRAIEQPVDPDLFKR